MPKPATARPLAETMTVVLRMQRQVELSKKLSLARKKRIKEQLGLVLGELQAADQGK
jgi:hypothetical protein